MAFTDRKLVRRGKVLEYTGWSVDYLKGLIKCGVVEAVHYKPNDRAWYRTEQIAGLVIAERG